MAVPQALFQLSGPLRLCFEAEPVLQRAHCVAGPRVLRAKGWVGDGAEALDCPILELRPDQGTCGGNPYGLSLSEGPFLEGSHWWIPWSSGPMQYLQNHSPHYACASLKPYLCLELKGLVPQALSCPIHIEESEPHTPRGYHRTIAIPPQAASGCLVRREEEQHNLRRGGDFACEPHDFLKEQPCRPLIVWDLTSPNVIIARRVLCT